MYFTVLTYIILDQNKLISLFFAERMLKGIQIQKKQNQNGKYQQKSFKQLQKKKYKFQTPNQTLPAISSSTQKLKHKITEFTDQKNKLAKTLEQAIQNNNLYRSISASQLQSKRTLQFLDSKHKRKQKSMLKLQKNLEKRLESDALAEKRLERMEQEVIKKKQAVSKRLAQIQTRNIQKIHQIQQFEKNFLAKVKQQMHKNLQKQKKLKQQFQKISKQNAKLGKIKQMQNKLDQDGWKSLMDQKINLQQLMSNQKRKQTKIIDEKNPQVEVRKQKSVPGQKEEGKKMVRQRVKLDMKQAGRQYLDFAKKKATTDSKTMKKLQKDYMNINLKVINYDNPVLQKIGHNDGMLSTVDENKKIPQEQNTSDINTNSNSEKKISKTNHPHEPDADILPILQQKDQQSQKSQFSDIEDTVLMVNRIKRNIKQIEQRYENKEKTS